MKKTKLDPQHIYLQFLMLFLTLTILLIFNIFVENLLWFNNANTTLPVLSGSIALTLSLVTLLIFKTQTKKKDNTFLFLSIFFFLLSLLTIFSTISQSLSSSTKIAISIAIVPTLLFFFLFFYIRKEWLYKDLYFWTIFSLSLFLFSRMFYLESHFKQTSGVVEYSHLINLFAYLILAVGFFNEFYLLKPKQKSAKKRKKK